MTLVYLIAFGAECLEQFKICYQGLKQCDVDIVLFTDQKFKADKVTVIPVKTVPKAKDQYIFRTAITDYLDLRDYDRVWYMDCDILVFGDIFQVKSNAIIVTREQKWTMGHDCFASALTHEERVKYYHYPAINGGLYSVPYHYYPFFNEYKDEVERFIKESPDINIPEQQVLNAMYARNLYKFEILDIGFPEKGVKGDEMVYHFACYKFEDKLKLMKQAWKSRTK